MVRQNLNLGGEQSGHVIFRDFTTTGDGIITALQILRIMHKTGQPLSKLKACLQKYPQAQRNLVVKEKRPFDQLDSVMKLVNAGGERAVWQRPRAAALFRDRAKDSSTH